MLDHLAVEVHVFVEPHLFVVLESHAALRGVHAAELDFRVAFGAEQQSGNQTPGGVEHLDLRVERRAAAGGVRLDNPLFARFGGEAEQILIASRASFREDPTRRHSRNRERHRDGGLVVRLDLRRLRQLFEGRLRSVVDRGGSFRQRRYGSLVNARRQRILQVRDRPVDPPHERPRLGRMQRQADGPVGLRGQGRRGGSTCRRSRS